MGVKMCNSNFQGFKKNLFSSCSIGDKINNWNRNIGIITNYTHGQVNVNKRVSVLSNYFDVSFEIYYIRLKYIDSIGQVVKLLILRPASIYCTYKHIGSLERRVLQMSTKRGALFISIHPGYG